MMQKQVPSINEYVMLACTNELFMKFKSSTLWRVHSMITVTRKIGINSYHKLKGLSKEQIKNTQLKSLVFTQDQIPQLIIHAPDKTYLLL